MSAPSWLPVSGEPEIGWWSAGRRRASRKGPRAFARRAAGPIARLGQRGLASPWRLPALHPPLGERKKGKQASPRLSNNRGGGALRAAQRAELRLRELSEISDR